MIIIITGEYVEPPVGVDEIFEGGQLVRVEHPDLPAFDAGSATPEEVTARTALEAVRTAERVSLRTWAAENSYLVQGEPPVLWTMVGGQGPLTTAATEALPVSTISHVYRGLLRTETSWRLEDVVGGEPQAGAQPAYRITYEWTLDPALGPVRREATIQFFNTAGDVILSLDWPAKTYGVIAGQENGAFSSRKAGEKRRANVLEAIKDISFAAIAVFAQATASDPAALAAAFEAEVGTLDATYLKSPAAGAALSATISGSTIPWLATPIPWLRWDNGSSQVVTATAAEHMLDELIQP